MPGSSKLSLSLGSPLKTLYIPRLSPIRARCRAYLILLDLITRVTFGEYRTLAAQNVAFCTPLLPYCFTFYPTYISLDQNTM
jgi:hypothetical protein